MNDFLERDRRLNQLLDELMQLDPEERDRLLDERCADDSEIRALVAGLLLAAEADSTGEALAA